MSEPSSYRQRAVADGARNVSGRSRAGALPTGPTTAKRASVLSIVVAQDSEPITVGQILRMFEDVRRELSVQVAGAVGSGAGLDSLRVEDEAIRSIWPGDIVTVTATVTAMERSAHRVDFMATCRAGDPAGRPMRSLLAHAHGWTVGAPETLPVSRAGDPGPAAQVAS